MILYILSFGQAHGYSIARFIEQQSEGFFDVKAGTLYPTLHSLEHQDLITSRREMENGRELRYYTLTDRGRKKLAETLHEWDLHVAAVNRVLQAEPS
jgi:DNA-binding PadR family transcriptional regulator